MMIGALIAIALVAPPPTADGASTGFDSSDEFGTQMEFFSPGQHVVVVPDAVHKAEIIATGADGGDGPYGALGGRGADVSGTLVVVPGEKLYVVVGRHGANSDGQACQSPPNCRIAPGGFNGGGVGAPGIGGGHSGAGGGGATDIQTLPIGRGARALTSRLIVAAGGGGAGGGGSISGTSGGTGGSGGKDGSEGRTDFSANSVLGGGGGQGSKDTNVQPGAGGRAGATGAGNPSYWLRGNGGSSGSSGVGGVGGGNAQLRPCPGCGLKDASGGGGGGGGGYFGGGGGGSGGIFDCPAIAGNRCSQSDSPDVGGGGGGGGGSSRAPRGAATYTFERGPKPFVSPPLDGSIVIEWGPANDSEVDFPGESVLAGGARAISAGPGGASALVGVACQTARTGVCAMKLTLAAHGHTGVITIGAATLRIAVGRYTTAVLTLNATGRKLLRRRHRLSARVWLRTTSGSHTRHIATLTLRLK
jgi:Glycine rich protein